jgi:hypothetical protein
MIASMLATTTLGLTSINGIKNVLVLIADLTAPLTFTFLGPVVWSAVPALAAGLFGGSLIGPPIARRLPVGALRGVIAFAGLGLAVALGVSAY